MRSLPFFRLVCLLILAKTAGAQPVLTFAGNAQHTAVYQPAAQDLNRIRWSTTIDQNNTSFAHYGAPLVTAANTVIVPVKTASGFQINVFNGSGAALYTLATDYIRPSFNWVPVYEPVVATGSFGTRLYYAGAGGTIYSIDNPDSASHTARVQSAFYGLSNYQANAAGFNSTVFINTPITADSAGNIFFGFRVQGTAPPPLGTTQSGFARIDPNGNATYVLAGTAAGDANIARDTHNSAPAISNDGSTVYVPVKSASTEYYGYLLGLDSTTLTTRYKVFLKDPRNSNANNAGILDDSTASPTVAPDGDVYLGIMANPDNGSRGFLLRFSGDLTVEKTPGGFGWDYTAAIVPASMAPLYTGSSPYLIFAKYNNYVVNGADGNGVNRIALLDPNATQIDPHPSANSLVEMREVLTAIGPTPDSENPNVPNAVREWCINTAAVNPLTNSIFTPSEDGHIYRWNLATNSLSQAVSLSAGVGEPYVPTVIGPDGTVYTLNGGTMFALGGLAGESVRLTSSAPDLRAVVRGQTMTFTAAVANTTGSGFTPTGTVSFQDTVYTATGSTTTPLATVGLDVTGNAAYTTSALSAAQHFINAAYSGDGNFAPGSMLLLQNIHTFGSTTSVSAIPNPSTPGQQVTFTATVATVPSSGTIPTGMVTFQEGPNTLAQSALGSGGTASFNTSGLSTGSHIITAVYASDSVTAASSGQVTQSVGQSGGATTTALVSSANPSVWGQSVTFTATIMGSGTPSGTVTFKDGSSILGTRALDATGHASFPTSILTVGAHSITAVYGGDGTFTGSTSAILTQTVNRAGTSTSLVSSLDPAPFGSQITFTATVTANAPGAGTPAGSVTFRDKNTVLGQGTLDAAGHASFATQSLTQGAHQITAIYNVSTNFNTSTSPTLIENIGKK